MASHICTCLLHCSVHLTPGSPKSLLFELHTLRSVFVLWSSVIFNKPLGSCVYPYRVMQNTYTTLSVSPVLHLFRTPLPQTSLPIGSPADSRMSYRWNHSLSCFQTAFFHWVICMQGSSTSSCGLMTPSSLNSTPWYGWPPFLWLGQWLHGHLVA